MLHVKKIIIFLNLNSCFLRAVELLQSKSSAEELAFALGSYGRALW